MTYYTRALPLPVVGRCCLCGRESAGLWCGLCLVPYIAAGERQPDAYVITTRRAPGEGKTR